MCKIKLEEIFMENYSTVSLSNLKGGAAVEMFDYELKKVLENILDVNTEHKAIREIQLTVKCLPSKNDRRIVDYHIQVKSKLAPFKSSGSQMFVGKENNRIIAREQIINQGLLFEPAEVKNIKGVK